MLFQGVILGFASDDVDACPHDCHKASNRANREAPIPIGVGKASESERCDEKRKPKVQAKVLKPLIALNGFFGLLVNLFCKSLALIVKVIGVGVKSLVSKATSEFHSRYLPFMFVQEGLCICCSVTGGMFVSSPLDIIIISHLWEKCNR
jgi:hypothetical protein